MDAAYSESPVLAQYKQSTTEEIPIDFGPAIDPPNSREVHLQVTSEVFSASQEQDTGEVRYFFYVQHQCVFSAEGIWLAGLIDAHHVGWWVASYGITTHLLDASGNWLTRDQATMLQNSPQTTTGATTYSSSISEEIGGSVGVFGADPTANLSGSLSLSSSRSFSVEDVTITNNSNDEPDTPSSTWIFDMKGSETTDPGIFTASNLTWPALAARSTFQPALIEYWELPEKIGDEFIMQMDITVNIAWLSDTSETDYTGTDSGTTGITIVRNYAPPPL